MAHKSNEAPPGTYDEDYHYYSYEEQPSGDYIQYKHIVSTNGTTRSIMHEEVDKEEYFKRKLAGTLDNDKLYTQANVYDIEMLEPWIKNYRKDV